MNPKKTSDIELFKNIVSQYQDRLFRFAYIRIGIREVAEDIVQDVFMRFYRAMIEGKEIKNHGSYLLRSISNSCIDWQRKKRETMISIVFRKSQQKISVMNSGESHAFWMDCPTTKLRQSGLDVTTIFLSEK